MILSSLWRSSAGSTRTLLLLGVMLGAAAASPASASADAAAAPAPAPSEMTGGDVRSIGGGYQLYFGGDGLRVRKGKRSAPLQVGDGSPTSTQVVGVNTAATAVTLSYMPSCFDVEQTYSHEQLAARLELEEGARLARRGNHAAAAPPLARAVALDPSYQPAVLAYGRTLVKLGRPDEAIAALGAQLTGDPTVAYILLTLDRPLTSLLDRPPLAHLRAATPGTAKLDPTSMTLPASGVARAPGGQLAFVETTGSHGACSGPVSLVIRDNQSLAERTEVELAGWPDYQGDGCDEAVTFTPAGLARIRARVAVANQVLSALGFEPLAGAAATSSAEPRPGVRTWRFGTSGVGLVAGSDGAARVFEGGKLVVEYPRDTLPVWQQGTMVLVPSEQRIMIASTIFGCEHAEERAMTAISIR